MFNIEEIRYLCSLNIDEFYLSPRSSYEYLIYGDIDHFEILIESSLDDWIEGQFFTFEKCEDQICLIENRDNLNISVRSLEGLNIEAYISQQDFSTSGVCIKISNKRAVKAFACLKDHYYASWIDPFKVREDLKKSYIRPIRKLHNEAEKYFEMIILMINYHLEVSKETLESLKGQSFVFNRDVKEDFFLILLHHHASYYIKILDDLGLIEICFPLVKKIKAKQGWLKGLLALKRLEDIIIDESFFSDGVKRAIKRSLDDGFECGLNRYQMLKFSLLFYNAHEVMLLKRNAPERYEEPFTSFCDYFGFQEQACRYYGFIIQASQQAQLDIINRMSLQLQYDFFDDFQDQSIDVLLIYYILRHDGDIEHRNHVEYLIKKFVNKYLEIQCINSEITTMDISRYKLSDVELTLLIEEVKKRIFFGNLRYDRKTIIKYLQKLIEQS